MSKKSLVLGAGCFWGVQYFFDQLDGVLETEVGYAGGHVDNPTYEQVCYEGTGHAEVCKITYDPQIVVKGAEADSALNVLLKYFFMMHDPTQVNRQGPDVGDQYRSVIFYENDEQQSEIKSVLELMQKSIEGKLATSVEKLDTFWPAEDYHQKFTERTGRGACHIDPSEIKLPM